MLLLVNEHESKAHIPYLLKMTNDPKMLMSNFDGQFMANKLLTDDITLRSKQEENLIYKHLPIPLYVKQHLSLNPSVLCLRYMTPVLKSNKKCLLSVEPAIALNK